MKLKTSCYDAATGRMVLRRFAPLWIVYTIGMMLLIAGAAIQPQQTDGYIYDYLMGTSQFMALINCAFACITVQLLFGDLYNTRLHYAIRALPITRGGWFGTQIILGLVGSLIPNLLTAGCLLMLVDSFRIVVLWWFAAVQMQYLFFFGAAVLCAVCAGNRFGMLVLYGMLNYLDVAFYWLGGTMYTTLIYGRAYSGYSGPLAPLANMMTPIFMPHYAPYTEDANGMYYSVLESVQLYDGFWRTAIFAAMGIALIWLAMVLYRRRKAECTGDLLAFPKMVPLFTLLFTLDAGSVGSVAAYAYKWELNYIMLFAGLILGYIACNMLLKRRVQVFRWKMVPPIAAICAVVLLFIVVMGLDVFGIAGKLPEASDIEWAQVHHSYTGGDYKTEDPAEIQMLLDMNRESVAEFEEIYRREPLMTRIFGSKQDVYDRYWESNYEYDEERTGWLNFNYKLKNGKVQTLQFLYHTSSPSMPQVRKILSDPQVVFYILDNQRIFAKGQSGTEIPLKERVMQAKLAVTHCIHDDAAPGGIGAISKTNYVTNAEELHELMEAILADCAEGNMVNSWFLHSGMVLEHLDIQFATEFGMCEESIEVPDCAEHTMQWLTDHGYHTNGYPKE